MADIGNVTGLSIRPGVDVSTADIEQLSKPMTQGALPASLAPQRTLEQYQLVGGVAQTSDRLRLEPQGNWGSTQMQMRNLASLLTRVPELSEHPFASKVREAAPILKRHLQYMRQITSELSHGRT